MFYQNQRECGESVDRRGTGRPNPSRENNFSDANGDRKNEYFPVQVKTRRIGNLFPVDPYSDVCNDLTYIHTYIHVEVGGSRGEPHYTIKRE